MCHKIWYDEESWKLFCFQGELNKTQVFLFASHSSGTTLVCLFIFANLECFVGISDQQFMTSCVFVEFSSAIHEAFF